MDEYPIETIRKSTVDEIRARFDADVERFSNLETGQTAAIDSALCLDLISEAAAATTPPGGDLLDVGCGAGNYVLKLLQKSPDCNVTLVDLSQPMLDRAKQRVSQATRGRVECVPGDVRELDLGTQRFDVVTAAAVLHHLRGDDEWRQVFQALHDCLRRGGSLWVFDMVSASTPGVEQIQRRRYSEYLVALQGEAYRDKVFTYIEQEDTPRPLTYQLDLMRQVGFERLEVLHQHACFAAFGGYRS